MKNSSTQQQIKQIFSSSSGYHQNKTLKEVSFTIKGHEVQFSLLEQLSELLRTKKINLTSRNSGCCCSEYCYCNNDSIIDIYCGEVVFDD